MADIKKKIPVGVDNFEDLIKNDFYYVDKTGLIEDLMQNWGQVNLFTRPRRFGKTLNMSMLKYFFEVGTDKTLFDGLYISGNKKLCDEYMGTLPVVFISLKNVDGNTFDEARYQLVELMAMEAERFYFLLDSDRLTENDKKRYKALIELHDGQYTMDDKTVTSALQILSMLLCRHYGRKTVILIDEYDVPLDKAFQNGYYKEMTALIRGLFGKALKSNEYLKFAVLTGCLRVSKESIFTGLNNMKILSITDARFDEKFGFTEEEVKSILKAYDLSSHLDEMREWYDGYHFGDNDVYCPWDVINHVDRLSGDPGAEPQAYWVNTSGNDLVRRFIDKADQTTRDEIECLMEGGTIDKTLRLDLTYDEIDSSITNLWSVLFTTGYLTQAGRPINGKYTLRIPNEEIREVYDHKIREMFSDKVLNDVDGLREFWKAFATGDSQSIERILTGLLNKTISIYDVKKPEGESFYHAFLSGILTVNGSWGVISNRESGDGRADIIIKTDDPDAGIIIELKKADTLAELDVKCNEAIEQIHAKRYDEYLRADGRNDIWVYGIAFFKKRCRVVAEKMDGRG